MSELRSFRRLHDRQGKAAADRDDRVQGHGVEAKPQRGLFYAGLNTGKIDVLMVCKPLAKALI
ncbi:hypothetical protein ACQZ46_00350 [Agrobacterium salinitolerans]